MSSTPTVGFVALHCRPVMRSVGRFDLNDETMDLLIELKSTIEAHEKNKIDYALCGRLALAVFARPRATLDIDIMIEPEMLA